jgi:hypothetical protein
VEAGDFYGVAAGFGIGYHVFCLLGVGSADIFLF